MKNENEKQGKNAMGELCPETNKKQGG